VSVVTEHLKQQGNVFDIIPHRQAYTSTDEARALGIDAGEVLKTLAVRTGSGYAVSPDRSADGGGGKFGVEVGGGALTMRTTRDHRDREIGPSGIPTASGSDCPIAWPNQSCWASAGPPVDLDLSAPTLLAQATARLRFGKIRSSPSLAMTPDCCSIRAAGACT
jgi:hypothetical protein